MAEEKTEKQLIKRKKFITVEVPITRSKIELIGSSPKELIGKTIKLDMTRQLKGKSVELVLKIKIENEKPVAIPKKITLMPYFIRRMIRKRISYIEDSFLTPSQESMLLIKPFLITKRRVSRQVRKTLRNKAKNWIEDYIGERKDNNIFSEILSNRMQKSLSLVLKKTYPLSLCEIRILDITRPLTQDEVPKIKPKETKSREEKSSGLSDSILTNEMEQQNEIAKADVEPVEFIDQMKEIEDEKIRQAEKEIKETQEKAAALSEAKASEPIPDFEPTSNLESSETKVSEPAIQEKLVKEKKARKNKVDKKE